MLEKNTWAALRSHLAELRVRGLRVENRVRMGTPDVLAALADDPRTTVWIEMKSVDRVVVELVEPGHDRRFNPLKIRTLTREQQMFLVDWRGMLVVRTDKQGWLLWDHGDHGEGWHRPMVQSDVQRVALYVMTALRGNR